MSKLVVFSDLHAHNYRRFDVDGSRLTNTVKALLDIYQHGEGIQAEGALFAGDLYDSQKMLPTSVVNSIVSAYSVCGLHTLGISGNHDHSTRNTIASPAMSALHHVAESSSYFSLIDNTYWRIGGQRVAGIPYYSFKEDFDAALNLLYTELGDKVDDVVLLIHQTPKGLIDFDIPWEVDPEDSRLQAFKMVFCGHIHVRRKLADNFWLVGNPLAQSFSDGSQDKGFLVYDTEANSVEFVGLDYPKFIVGEDAEDGNYYRPDISGSDKLSSVAFTGQDFDSANTPADLVKSYWADVDGVDEDLLTLGLHFIS